MWRIVFGPKSMYLPLFNIKRKCAILSLTKNEGCTSELCLTCTAGNAVIMLRVKIDLKFNVFTFSRVSLSDHKKR